MHTNINMKKIAYGLIAVVFFCLTVLPGLVAAQVADTPVTGLPPIIVTADGPEAEGGNLTIQQLVTNYIVKGANYLVVLIIGMTVLVFMYGLMKYMFKGRESDSARTEGRKLMLWGIIGIFVMISVWGLVGILSNTLGHTSNAIPQFQNRGTTAVTSGQDLTNGSPDNVVEPAPRQTVRERLREFFRNLREGRQNAN